MKSDHIGLRESFNNFWQSKNHKEIPPAPLVPKDDPTTLFTGSGMQQLVPYLKGEKNPRGNRLYNIQPCFRAEDIEEVGDNRHTTFFEMMGNWSLGDYFKQEQLPWVLEYYTKVVSLPFERLYVTVFEGEKSVPKDEESFSIWKKLGIPEEKIHLYGTDHNWWSRSGTPDKMPAGEIGGPDSEVFYDFGEDLKLHEKSGIKEKCHPNCECGRFTEIGNSVFIQYEKRSDGTLSELPQKNVDYGGGLERLSSATNNTPDIFNTDLYSRIIAEIEKQSNSKYSDEKSKPQIQILADHLKAATFLILDGVRPSNKEHGYVLRRLLRRSVVKFHQLNPQTKPNFDLVCSKTLETYGIEQGSKDVSTVVNDEVERFAKSLDRGLKEVQKLKNIDGKVAFDLYQSFGFPLELTEELLKEKGQSVNRRDFKKEFEKHKEISRKSAAGRFKGGLADTSAQTIKYHTATHLIHQALFDVLGEVRQEGSNITTDRLRFDFFSEKRPTDENIKKVEEIVNEKIKEDLPVLFEIMSRDKANQIGARAFFKEKYADQVKVYFVGDYSKEFCGGPHVKNTKEIERIEIFKFEKIGSNIYRVYAK